MAIVPGLLGRGEGAAPVTASVDAGAVCRWLARGIERGERPHAGCAAYGAEDCDPILVGAEHITTVLVRQGAERRWFRVEVQEFDPDELPLSARNHAVLATVQRRATGEVRPFDLGLTWPPR